MALEKIADKVIETDVLVMGGGTGGCPAACKAAEHGLDVTIVEKSKLERSGKVAIGLGEIMPFPRDGVSTLDLVKSYWGRDTEDTQGVGMRAFSDPNVLYKIFDNGLWMIEEFERLGVNMRYLDGKYGWLGTTLQVHWIHAKPEMAAAVRKRGVKVLDRTVVVDLLTDNGKVAGATAVNTRTGEFIVIKAKAVVIATGDCSRHYNPTAFLSWKYKMICDNWPASMSGDGHAVAYRAGADLTTMEMMRYSGGSFRDYFCGRHTTISQVFIDVPRKIVTWTGEEAPRTQDQGPVRYLELERKGLDILYMSPEGLPDESFKSLEVHISDERPLDFKTGEERGFNPKTHWYQMMRDRSAFFFRGHGIMVDENLASSLKGVYATGECTDSRGVGGAGAATGGFLIGDNIHKYVSSAGEPVVDEAQVVNQKQAALAPLAVKDGIEPMELECAIRYICEEYSGSFKTEGRLREGLRRLGSLKRVFMPRLMAINPHYLLRCVEVRNIMDMAELHLQTALERKETRGQHVRLDYPERDPSLDNRRICQRIENGNALLEIKEIPDIKPEYTKEKK